MPQTSKPLNADVTIRLREPSGRVLSDRVALKVNTGKSFVGVKPLFEGSVPEGAPAEFEIVGIGPDGKQTAVTGLKWDLQRVESQFQWYNKDNRWSYELVTYENRVAGGVIDTAPSGAVKIKAPVSARTYRLDIASASAQGPATSLSFSAGWYVSETSDTPEILNLALDKASYRPGDDIKV